MYQAAQQLVALATERGMRVAVAESLTGGAVASAIVDVPGASECFRGGAVTYATDAKASVLGVSEAQLERTGPVDPDVAREMASGVRQLFGADLGVATTGVAGPGPSDGAEAGTVYIGWSDAQGEGAELCHFDGDRPQVRVAAVKAALEMLVARIRILASSENPR